LTPAATFIDESGIDGGLLRGSHEHSLAVVGARPKSVTPLLSIGMQ
jgi:hypothetical protein